LNNEAQSTEQTPHANPPAAIDDLLVAILATPDPMTAAINSLVAIWNYTQEYPGAQKILYKLFGTDIGGGPTHSVATTVSGLARPVDDGALAAIPDLIAAARAEGAHA
jgi:hypothetical protein